MQAVQERCDTLHRGASTLYRTDIYTSGMDVIDTFTFSRPDVLDCWTVVLNERNQTNGCYTTLATGLTHEEEQNLMDVWLYSSEIKERQREENYLLWGRWLVENGRVSED